MPSRIERFFYLEDLQDLGDRYSPSVLGRFIASHGLLLSTFRRQHRYSILSDYTTLPDSAVEKLTNIFMMNAMNFSISVFVSIILFGFSSSWDSPVDPTTLAMLIRNAQPSGWCIAIAANAIVFSVSSEVYSCVSAIAIREIFVVRKVLLLVTSVLSQISTVTDILSMVVMFHTAKSLLFIASFAVGIQIVVFGILLPLKSIFDIRKKLDGRFDQYPRFTAPGNECDVRGIGVQSNSGCLRSLAFGCVVFNWRLLDDLIRSRLGSVPMEGALLLQTIVIEYFRCYSYQLIWIPLKVFFLLDYGFSNIVLVSITVSVLNIFLGCLTNVFPINSNIINTADTRDLVDVVV